MYLIDGIHYVIADQLVLVSHRGDRICQRTVLVDCSPGCTRQETLKYVAAVRQLTSLLLFNIYVRSEKSNPLTECNYSMNHVQNARNIIHLTLYHNVLYNLIVAILFYQIITASFVSPLWPCHGQKFRAM